MSAEQTPERAQRSGRRPRPPLLREQHVPPDAATRADMVRRLTATIASLEKHLRSDPAHWRDRKTLRSLEKAINARSEILELLRSEQPTVWDALCAELHLSPSTR